MTVKVTVSYQLNCQRHPPEEGVLVNISETGLCLKTKKALPKDAVVFVDLELPETEEKARAIGKVMWNNPNGEAGIELGYIPARQFKFLAPFLQAKSSSDAPAAATPSKQKS